MPENLPNGSSHNSFEERMHKKAIVVLAGIGLMFQLPAESNSVSKLDTNKQAKSSAQSALTYEPSILDLGHGLGCSVLSKEYGSIPGPRIVLAFLNEGKYELNPRERAYPKSTDLHGLSFEAAVLLFGKARKTSDGITTFDLMLATQGLEYRKEHLYQLDTKFVDGALQCYKLRGENIGNPFWIQP